MEEALQLFADDLRDVPWTNAGDPGIQGSENPGIQEIWNPGIQESEYPGIQDSGDTWI